MKTIKLQLSFSESAYEELKNLADEFNMGIDEVIRLSLGLMKSAAEAKRNHNSIGIVRGATVIKEIILPE